MKARWHFAAMAVAAAIKLWLIGVRTLEAIGWAGHDDWWFLQRAINILHGEWLGPYNHLTLIKGQGYPLWVAFISLTHIPILFAQQLLYALACFAVCRALAPALRSPLAEAIVFVVTLFNPMTASDDTSMRVTREGLYPALTVLVFAGAVGAVLRLDRRRLALAWAAMCGVALALFWHTREEGVWIAPIFAAALLVLILKRRPGAWLVAVVPAVIVLVAHFALVIANGLHYGVYAVVEFKWTPFLRAYGSLIAVRSHPPQPRFPVPREARERIYAVSPAFAELRPQLEGQLGIDWRRNGSTDLGGESFMWAFREALEKIGYYKRGSAAVRDYYERVAREIEAARRDGRLDARKPRASLIPPLLYGQRRATFETWLRGLKRVSTFEDLAINAGRSEGYDSELRAFAETTHARLAPRQIVELGGVDAFRLNALRRIGRVYQLLFPWAFALAMLLYLPAIRRDWTLTIIIAGLLGAIAARVLLLSLIDVTSFYVFTAGYQSPEYPLILIAAAVAGCAAARALSAR